MNAALKLERGAAKYWRKRAKQLEAALEPLAALFDADATGGYMLHWFSDRDLRHMARRANKVLGRDRTLGRKDT